MKLLFEENEVYILTRALCCARGCTAARKYLTEEEEEEVKEYDELLDKIHKRLEIEIYISYGANFLNQEYNEEKFKEVYNELLRVIPPTDEFWLNWRNIAMKKGYFKEDT